MEKRDSDRDKMANRNKPHKSAEASPTRKVVLLFRRGMTSTQLFLILISY